MRLSNLDMSIRLGMGIIDGLIEEYDAIIVPFFWWRFWEVLDLDLGKKIRFGRYWVVSWWEK